MPTKPRTNNKAITQVSTPEEIGEYLVRNRTNFDPVNVLNEVNKKIKNRNRNKESILPKDNLFKALTIIEFYNGMLMSTIISEQYKTFGIDLMRNLQKEYNCQTPSEKATTELVVVNYIRTLEIERKINNYLNLDSFTDTGIRYLAVLSKELDRANRHYLASIQALKAMKQLPMQFNIKTDTAIIGQNQMVQANRHE